MAKQRTEQEYRELSKSQYYRDLNRFIKESEKAESVEPNSGLSQGNHLESIVKNEPEEISKSVTSPENLEEKFHYPSGSHSVPMVKIEPEEEADNSGENPFGLEKFFVTYVNKPVKRAKPSCSKAQAGRMHTDKTDETLSDEDNTKLEDCCCKHVQYIYHQLRKNDVGKQKHKKILKKLPLQTKEELEEFDKSLYVQSNKDAFVSKEQKFIVVMQI